METPNETIIPVLDDEVPAGTSSASGGSSVPVLREDAEVTQEQKLPIGAERMDNGSIRLTFKFPVTLQFRSTQNGDVRTEHHTELVFGRMNGTDLTAVTNTSKDSMMQVAIARSCRMSVAKINLLWDVMDARDTYAAMVCVGIFLGSGP